MRKTKKPQRKSTTAPLCKNEKEIDAVKTLLEQITSEVQDRIVSPGTNAVKRFTAIPLLHKNPVSVTCDTGYIDFDSWAALPAVQMRDISPGFIRRICLTAKNITLEIVAERQQSEWEFTARVYDSGETSQEWILSAGGKKLLPKSLGFYHWTSQRTPSRLRIFNNDRHISFEKLKWA